MRQRSLKNQHRMLEVLLERFSAVDVTGLSAWEKARAVHGRSAAGLAEGVGGNGAAFRGVNGSRAGRTGDAGAPSSTPSASPVAIPLFTEEAA